MSREKIKTIPFLGFSIVWGRATLRKLRERFYWYKFYLHNKKFLRKNRELEGTYVNRRCFILATGLSINKTDVKKLKGELSISVSDFYVHPDFKTIKPEFHFFAMSHSPITEEQYKFWFEDAGQKMPEGQKVFVALSDKPIVDRYNLFKKQHVYYYFTNTGSKKLSPLKKLDFSTCLPTIGTSPHTATYLAFFLGCKEINLVGIDHTWIVNNLSEKTQDHFYKNEESAIYRAGWRPRESGIPQDMEKTFLGYLRLWKSYKAVKRYAESRGVSITNCSPDSLLDVFPKKTLDDILHKTQN